MMSSYRIIEIRDYSQVRVFKDADVYPVVFIAAKRHDKEVVTMAVMSDLEAIESSNSIAPNTFYRDVSWDKYFTSDLAMQIDAKCSRFKPLETYFPGISGAATVSEAYKFKEVVYESGARSTRPAMRLINTGTIDRYSSLWGVYPTRYIKGSYKHPVIDESDIKRISPNRLLQAKSKKIIIGGMTKELECAYDDGQYLAGKSTVIVLEGLKLPLKYALALLNSRLISFWYRNHFKSMSLAGGYLRIGQNEIRSVPIAEGNEQKRQELLRITDAILEKKTSTPEADTTDREHQIDCLVYDIYGLTPQEVAAVEKPFEA
jgi:TaqI-like C-terminal specificity domain